MNLAEPGAWIFGQHDVSITLFCAAFATTWANEEATNEERKPKRLFMKTSHILFLAALGLALSITTNETRAHCDALDGPVVEAARLALEKKSVTPVLKWVNQNGEKEIHDV